jgi:hypothetical protein
MVQLATGHTLVVLLAGSDRDTLEVITRLAEVEDRLGNAITQTKRTTETAAKEATDFLVERLYLSPRQLTRTEYVAAISGGQVNSYIKEIAQEIHMFELDCSLLLCGAEKSRMFILYMDSKGIVTDMTPNGFHAIGSGSEKALSNFLFSEHKRDHDIDRVLYDAFDAKANAELAVGVGYEWDAWIMLPGKMGVHPVPKDVKDLVQSAWSKFNRSPFEKYNPKEDRKGPPQNWKEKLREFSDSIIKSRLGGPPDDK